MRLVTYHHDGAERVGAWINNDRDVFDLQRAARSVKGHDNPAFNSMQALIDEGDRALEEAQALLSQANGEFSVPTTKCRILAPLPRPLQLRDFLSFPEHVRGCRVTTGELTIAASSDPDKKRAELQASGFFNVPKGYYDFPVYYISNRLAVFGDGDDIVWPQFSSFIDFELEWAAVIGKRGEQILQKNAADHIFGYTIFNDWSARDEQMKAMGGPINLGPGVGKDFANSLGPCIVTRDEIKDPYNLSMKAFVNGEQHSEGSTSSMHYRFEELIEYLTRGHSVYPGEILGSGTVGTGCALETRRPVSPNDTIELKVEQIGTLRNRVVANHLAKTSKGAFDDALTKSLQLAIKA